MATSNNTWNHGHPPSIGWWPASIKKDPKSLRWFNGKRWSKPARSGFSLARVGSCTAEPAGKGDGCIMWKARPKNWPARSLT